MSDSQLSASQGVGISPAPSEPATSIATPDPASSLRAAALLTLKSKRRKAQPSSTLALPTRPPADTTFQLDYGTEESPSVPRLGSPAEVVEPPKPSPPPESQTREEGEISDEENAESTLVLPRPRSPAPLQPSPDTNIRRRRDRTPSTSALPRQPALRLKPSLSERISEAPNVSDSAAPAQGDTLDHMQLFLNPASEDPHHLLDADHVRPGVALNQIQYDRAKDNVLDLLGWGVAPEYLVDCGLTREMVFYVFSELNLRLPQNLDTTGLIPYTPETPSLIERRKLALMPPPPPPQPLRSSDVHLSPSSPASAQCTAISPPIETSPAPLPGTSSGPMTLITVESPQGAVTGNLHDMEQQRRQELLARKAVIASRKSKQVSIPGVSPTLEMPVSAPSFPSSSRQDIEMAVLTETVDDFLKTIGSSPKMGETSTDSSPPHQRLKADDMDVDEIPGLGGPRQHSATTLIPSHSNTGSAAPPNDPAPPAQPPHTPAPPDTRPPSSTESTSTSFTEKSGSHTPSDTPALSEGTALQRRGAKRPVAADFVDFDSGSRPSISGNGGYTAGIHSGSRRRTGAGFANVASARRFIIDLSDSEGEGEGDVVMRDPGLEESAGRRSAYASPVPTRPTFPSLTTPNGWATPPVPTPTPITSAVNTVQSATMSPAALVEKEIQIQKMRELIAQREQRRLQKIAAAKANAETSISTSTESVSVKREEAPTSFPTGNISSAPDSSGISASQPPQLLDQRHVEPATSSVNVSSSSSCSAPAYATPPIDFVARDDTLHTLNATQEAGTGEQVLNTEAQQKHVVISDVQEARTSANGSVDVDSSTSTQILEMPRALVEMQTPLEDSSAAQEQHDQYYSTYDSPLKWYPLLPSRARRLCTSSNLESPLLSSSTSTSNALSSPSSSSLSSFSSVSSSSSSSSSVSFSHSIASRYPFRTDTTTSMLPDLRPLKLATASRLLDPSKRICQYEVPGGGVCRDEGCEDMHLSRIAGQGGRGGAEPSDQDTAEYLLNTLPSNLLADSGVSQSKMSSALQQVRLKNPQLIFEERVARALAALGPLLAP